MSKESEIEVARLHQVKAGASALDGEARVLVKIRTKVRYSFDERVRTRLA